MNLTIKDINTCEFCRNLTTAHFIDDDADFGESEEFVCRLKANESGNYNHNAIVINLNGTCVEYSPKI